MDASLKKIIELLNKALCEPSNLGARIKDIQDSIWECGSMNERIFEILNDLAHDLEYYEADPAVRAEDDSFFDETRAQSEIRGALQKIHDLLPS